MFIERQLQLTFSGEQTGTLEVSGLRTYAAIQAFSGKLGTSAQVKVWGLSEAQMDTYSSAVSSGVGVDEFNLQLEAGDVGGQLSEVINGAIWRSYIDLTEAPESSFNVSVAGTIYAASTPIASQSWSGSQPAETMIQAICKVAGLTFANNGAHAVLRNMATYGDAIAQIESIATAAKFAWIVQGSTVTIWPRTQPIDQTVVSVGPDTGMVGYPEFWEAGIIVKSLFNQEAQVGRQMQVTSSLKNAAGAWQIIRVRHDLSTMLRNGPWFTTCVLAPVGFA